MLVNISRDTAAEHRKLLLAGVAMVVVIVLLIGLSVAVYQKVFKSVVMVTVQAGNAGLQLAEFGDVRINGVLVGQVRDIEQTGDEAVIQLALEPDEADSIPANVNVEILPTTLFGQKYISLSAPEDASEESIAEGDVIPSDRVSTAVELNRVLNQLFPLLRAVRPVDLNQTLSALATALNGRGAEIGRSLDNLDSYLTTINEHIPAFEEDIRLLADVAETYDMAIPDFVRLLRNTTVTSRTVLEKQQQLSAFFQDVAGVSDTASRVLGANEDSLIRFGQVTRPVLRVLDVYAPEYPCLLKGVARYEGRLAEVFSGDRVKQYIEIGAAQRRAYNRSDQPVYGEVGHGPWCLGLPNSSLAKLIVFTMASLVVTGLLAAIMGNIGFGDTTAYSARFTTASMLQPGDDVRVAGVIMGEVSEVEIEDRTQALVTFTVKNGLPMTQDSGAEIRFLNLVGDRYLTLTQGEPGAPALSPGATIPIARTSPALNLTTLFNGFQPLFAALAPEDVNELSMNLVRTLQGEGGTVESLLAHTASLTTTLADRDQLIGDVINNLNTMLGTVDSKREELSLLITCLLYTSPSP